MKKFINSFFLAVFSLTAVKAQNTPTGSTLGMYPSPTLITLPTAYNQGSNAGALAGGTTPVLNYRRVFQPQLPTTSISSLDLNAPNNISVATNYVNGWGKLIQSNMRGPVKDIISVNDYRASSHQYSFLPFTANTKTKFVFDPFNDQRSFYNGLYSDEGGTSYSDAEMPVDQSTITQKTRKPGKAFVGQGVGNTATTTFNVANELPIFEKGTGGIPYIDGYYNADQIRIITSEDPEGGVVKEYYNKDNQLLCKSVKELSNSWLKTYYMYDFLGRIVTIIPPKAINTSNVVSLTECFTYLYDNSGNLVNKYAPGLEPGSVEEAYYDVNNRKYLSRSPKMKDDGQYAFTIYDDLNRVVAEGILYSTAEGQGLLDYLSNSGPNGLEHYRNNPPENMVSITDCDVLVFNTYDGTRISTGVMGQTMTDVYYTGHSSLYRTDAGAITPAPYKLNQGLLTGSAVKVIDAANINNQLNSNYTITQYDYDKKGQLIQARSTSPWNNLSTIKEVVSYQYNFKGQTILKVTDQNGPNEGQTNNSKPVTRMQNAWYYDVNNGGRVTSVKQKMDSEDWRVIATYEYDQLGRTSRKTMGGVENQFYTYDMRGGLNGINADYVENGYQSTNLPARFGVKIFDEYGFATARKDGKASGIVWRGAGVSANKNAYGYKYDQVGRLTHAEYREYSNSTYISQIDINGNPIYAQGVNWNKQHKDYTAMNMTYDVNGNMLSMTQVGVPLGYNTPMYIDVMKYFYDAGNRQKATADAITYNYHLDEFVDGTCDPEPAGPGNGEPPLQNKGDGDPITMEPYFELGNPPAAPSMGCVDYQFDKNGNLTHDGNKWMNIAYNYMNLPTDITVLNGSGNNSNQTSTIHNTYDGSGTLLRKVIKDYTVDPPKIDKYDYDGPFTYRNDSLLDVGHEEGKVRYVATATQFTYDYFVEDHLGNVRAVINAQAANPVTQVATYELASANLESSIFSNINQVNQPNPIPGMGNMRAAKLNGAYDSTRIGASLLLRVMPEDEIELSSLYYYEDDTVTHTVTPSADMLGSLVSALTGGVGGYSGNEGPSGRIINGLLNSRNYTSYFDAIKEAQTDPNLPRAYMSYMVFDRNMNLLADKSGVIQVGAVSGSWDLMELDHPLVIGQDGYVLISVGDEIDKEVHFDQVKVTFYKGLIKQEQHYYPYGLAIKAGEDASVEPNQNKYQGKELQDELNVQLYDFHARQYDPQIGKFWGLDPLDQFPSGYIGMANDPANMVDPTGMKAQRTAMDPPEDEYRWNSEYGKYVVISGDRGQSLSPNGDWHLAQCDGYAGQLFEAEGKEAVEQVAETDRQISNQATEETATDGGLCPPGYYASIGKFRQFMAVGDIFMGMHDPMGLGSALMGEIDSYNPLSLSTRGIFGATTGENLYTGQPQSLSESGTQILMSLPVGRAAGAVERTVANVAEKNVVNSTKKFAVYEGMDKVTGATKYVGITSQSPLKRFAQHLASGTERSALRYRVISGTSEFNRSQARVFEQKLINHYGLDNLLNQRNSIAPKFWLNYGIK